MASKKVAASTGPRDATATVPEIDTTPQPTPERRYVDVDPWAMLLEQLMVVPEEEPATRTRPKKKKRCDY